MEEVKTVENPQDPTKKTEEGIIAPVPEQKSEDLTVLLTAQEEKIKKLERDNADYRTGMLSWKKKALKKPTFVNEKVVEDDDIEEEDKVRAMIREEMMKTDLAKANSEKEDIIRKIIKENQEIKIALQNKSQISNLPGGNSQETATGEGQKPMTWTKEQLDYFKSKRLDPNKVADNWKKSKL